MPAEKLKIKHILFAEDDEDDRAFFQDIIRSKDPKIKIDVVDNGQQLLELLTHYCPDLLFLDLDMPYKNGLECLLSIRNNPVLANLPVVVFSSTSRPANIQTAYEMGAHLFLIKSSTYSEYSSSIRAILDLDWSDPGFIKNQYCVNNRYAAFS